MLFHITWEFFQNSEEVIQRNLGFFSQRTSPDGFEFTRHGFETRAGALALGASVGRPQTPSAGERRADAPARTVKSVPIVRRPWAEEQAGQVRMVGLTIHSTEG